MKDININNYEAYLLDLAEGELSLDDKKLLMLFLDKHPDIKAEHNLFELEEIVAANIRFENKSDLKKTSILSDLTESNFDELCIAKLEGDLIAKEAIEFDKLLKSDEIKEKEYELYKLTQLVPDQTEIYRKKGKLKKKEARVIRFRRSYTILSVAASIILLIGLYLFMPKQNEDNILVSETTKNSIKEELQEGRNAGQKNETIAFLNEKEVKIDIEETADQALIKTYLTEKDIDFNIESVVIERNIELIASLDPVEIDFNVGQISFEGIIENLSMKVVQERELSQDNSITLKTYLAKSFNKRVLKKEDKNKVELFDLAQAGLESINKFTGTQMSLEKVYDENGVAERTQFNSRLLAFSAPVKKN